MSNEYSSRYIRHVSTKEQSSTRVGSGRRKKVSGRNKTGKKKKRKKRREEEGARGGASGWEGRRVPEEGIEGGREGEGREGTKLTKILKGDRIQERYKGLKL
uniref:Uncharacterized protein n=1 Tax=Oryza punctata TaxID=4537 RepID=A0A0E0L9W3_ORYPU